MVKRLLLTPLAAAAVILGACVTTPFEPQRVTVAVCSVRLGDSTAAPCTEDQCWKYGDGHLECDLLGYIPPARRV